MVFIFRKIFSQKQLDIFQTNNNSFFFFKEIIIIKSTNDRLLFLLNESFDLNLIETRRKKKQRKSKNNWEHSVCRRDLQHTSQEFKKKAQKV
jgi:hypothetical protein